MGKDNSTFKQPSPNTATNMYQTKRRPSVETGNTQKSENNNIFADLFSDNTFKHSNTNNNNNDVFSNFSNANNNSKPKESPKDVKQAMKGAYQQNTNFNDPFAGM